MPIGWVAAAAAVAGVAGSVIQSDSQRQAAHTQSDMFNKIVSQEQPFLQAGQGATGTLAELLGTQKPTGEGGNATGTTLPGGYLTQQFNPTEEQLQNYPGYQFALKTGGQALRNADTPGMGALSGAALKDLMNFNVGTANTYYGNYFDQFQTQQNNIFNRLHQLASLGQNAAGNLGSAGASLGTGIAQAQAAQGASLGAGVSNAGNTVANSYLLSKLINNQNNGGGGSIGTGVGGGN